jgi:hypothetical protein
MNTHEPYERQMDRTLDDAVSAAHTAEREAAAGQEVSPFAVHRDPSHPQPQPQPAENEATGRSGPGVAWVRPTELPALLGSPWVGRGIDLQAELTRRARRAPARGAGRMRQVTRTAISPVEATPTTGAEGVEL